MRGRGWVEQKRTQCGTGLQILTLLLTVCVTLNRYFPSLGSFLTCKMRMGIIPSVTKLI